MPDVVVPVDVLVDGEVLGDMELSVPGVLIELSVDEEPMVPIEPSVELELPRFDFFFDFEEVVPLCIVWEELVPLCPIVSEPDVV